MSNYQESKRFVQSMEQPGYVMLEGFRDFYNTHKDYVAKVDTEAANFLTKARNFRSKDFTDVELPFVREVILSNMDGFIVFKEMHEEDGEPEDEGYVQVRDLRENFIFTEIEDKLKEKVPGYQLPAGLKRIPPLAERLLDPAGTAPDEVVLAEVAEGLAADPALDASVAASAEPSVGVAHAPTPTLEEAPQASSSSSAARSGAGLFGTQTRQAEQTRAAESAEPASAGCHCIIM